MKLKSLIAAAASALLIASPLGAQGAQWTPERVPDQTGIHIVDNFVSNGEQASRLTASVKHPGAKFPDERLCEEFDSGICDFTKNRPGGVLLLPACTAPTDENCVAGLALTVGDNRIVSSFTEQLPGPKVKADPARGLPEGSTTSLWALPAESGLAIKTYSVYAAIRVQGFENGKFILDGLSVVVSPYTEISGARYIEPRVEEFIQPNGRPTTSISGGELGCAWTANNRCGSLEDFDEDTRVEVEVRVTNKLGGWFRGRMQAPEVSVSKHSGTANVIKVSGASVEVPMVYISKPKDQIKPELTKEIKRYNPGWQSTGIMNTRADYGMAIDFIKAGRTTVNDTASGTVRVWNFSTVSAQGNPCLTDTSKVLGIVTTNSTAYQGSAPSFNKGALDYRLAGMHYLPDGETESLGSYDLVMRSEVARCLYKFSKAPVSATISITGEGDKTIATTVVSEKGGWLKLAAYGFTFSEKTVKVKLTQGKQTTITCVAPGKKSKKVTAANPKCPKGFRKR